MKSIVYDYLDDFAVFKEKDFVCIRVFFWGGSCRVFCCCDSDSIERLLNKMTGMSNWSHS